MSSAHAEALAAAAYAALLICSALALDVLARHSHRRSGRFRTAGFTFHQHLDAWECPEGQHLRRFELDQHRRAVRYRGKASICNACPTKDDCTDSDQGREIVQPIDPWPHSEAGRFHRGISLALLLLAGVIMAVELVRNHGGADLVILGSLLGVLAVVGSRMVAGFRRAPTNFPGSPQASGQP